jgi:Taurine catabolism dioxygenase TauD, TfdA family
MSTFAAASSAAAKHGCADHVGRYDAGDLRRPRGLARMSELLAAEGLALFHGRHNRTAVLQAASAILAVRRHPDADPDGVTVITDLGATGDLPGAAGFSRRELTAHTDGSRTPDPPGLLMAVCLQPAAVGGASTLTDGLAIVGELTTNWPEALATFARPRSVLFGGADGYLGGPCGCVISAPRCSATWARNPGRARATTRSR